MSNRRALSNAVKESKQPKQLSKPKDIDYNSKMGYRDDSPFRNKSSIDINTPTGSIDMSNTGIPLMANGRYLPPYSGTHKFDTNVVREVPLTQAKKGGGLKSKKYSRSLQATNKFFRENPLFEKPKKLSKKRIYDPNAKYYQDGGLTVGTSTSYPSGIGVGNLANYVPSQMANLKIPNPFKLEEIKTPLEISIGTPLGGANSRRNTYQGFQHPSTGESAVSGPAQSSQDLINSNKANFNNWQETKKGAPIDFRVKQSFYGITQNKDNPLRGFASIQGGYHPQTGFNAGAEGGVNLVLSRNGQANRYFSNRGLIPKQTVFVPQLTMGYGIKQKLKGWDQDTLNEYENLLNQDAQNNTTNSFDYLNEESKKGHLTGSRANFAIRPQFTIESRPTRSPLTVHGTIGANMNMAAGNRAIDNSGGTRSKNTLYGEVGVRYPVDKMFDKKSKAKSKIQEVQDREQEYEKERPVKPVEQKEPEEQTEWIGEHPRWLRDGGSTDNYVEIDIPKDQIQKYVDGGYIVEDISVPELNTYAEGGEPCPDGYRKNYLGTDCVPMEAPEQTNDEEWYRNWYANRMLQDEEGQQLLETARPKILKRAEKFPEEEWYTKFGSSESGSFEPLTGKITLNRGRLDSNPFLRNEVKFHEKGHYLTSPSMLDPETDTAKEVDAHPIQQLKNYEADVVNQALKERKDIPRKDRKYYDYLKGKGKAKPYVEEISKNLMQARRLAGFKPGQVITDEDINNFYKQADEKGWTNPDSELFVEPLRNLKDFTKGPEELKMLFNKLAENKAQQEDEFQFQTARYGGSLDTYAGGGAACPRGYVRDASGKCVPYNFSDIQAADSYKGMYGGYDKKGVKNLKQETIVAKKGKKFSDYVLRGGKTKADMAKKLGKDAGQYFGMPGEALQPTNFTKAGLEKYNKTIKDAKKNFEAEEKSREEYEKAVKKKESGKMSTDKFARQYKEKGWADKYDPATMKEGYKGQFQDAVDEANARKTENYELVKNVAGELSGYNAAGRIYDDPLGTLKGIGQTVADVASLPFGLTTGAYNYATDGNFDMGKNIIGQNYGEGLDEVGDVASILPFGSMLGAAGKAAKLTKAGDVAGDLGKFITTQTPVKNTYKVLGRDSKFFNPGEQPNWLKGYQQTWDPDVADLAPLAAFDKKLKTPELIPKFKKQYQSITDKKNSITTDYRKKIQKAKDNPELIKKAEQERESAMAKMTEATDKFEADVLNYNIKKYSPFEKQIGSGGFGKVFSIPGSDKVVKIGRQAPGEIPEELIKRAQGLDKPNVAIPNRIENLEGIVDATVMKKVDNLENSPESLFSGTHVRPTSQAYEQLVYDIQDLQDRGLYADFQNPDNIIFNPQTGKYHIYDLNTTGHYMSKNITPEMGYKFKADTQFPGIQVPDTEGHSVLKILKDQGKVPKDFQLPNYVDLETTKIADDLTFRKANPYNAKNTDNDYGKSLVAQVTKGKGFDWDQQISLRKYKQPSGEEAYYFSANMKNPVEAGRAFKKLESQIPKGSIIQEPASLSLDSWSALLKQAQNPKKFQVYPGNKVPLNMEAVHKKLPNQDKLLRGLEDEMGWESKMASYATREDAQEAADYINTLIPKEFRATKANVFQNDPKKEIYNIAVPNYRIKKMYKQGGQSNDYIEMDIPKSKVQWYIDNGYDVEVLE